MRPVFLLVGAALAFGQPVSYVASIKPNKSVGARTITESSPGGRFSATAVTVRELIRIAYRIQPYQLSGAPGWISDRRYDIAAKAEDTPAPSQQALIGALLKDRFQMEAHNETRVVPILALVPAGSGGKRGPGLTHSDFDCAAYMAGPHPRPEPGRTPACGARINPGSLSAKAIPMSRLASALAPFVNRFVVDKTGLSGGFDVELTWTPEAVLVDSTKNSCGPSIFTALEEQLGLKLISEKGPVDVLVIDRIEEPSDN